MLYDFKKLLKNGWSRLLIMGSLVRAQEGEQADQKWSAFFVFEKMVSGSFWEFRAQKEWRGRLELDSEWLHYDILQDLSIIIIVNAHKNSIGKVDTRYRPNPPSVFYIPVHCF